MNVDNETAFWIGGQTIALIASGVAAYIKINQRIAKLEFSEIHNSRMRETFELIGRRALETLHSPTDHLGLDKIIDEYIARDGELSPSQWQEIRDTCLERGEQTNEKWEAVWIKSVAAFADHKLKAFQGTRMPEEKK